MQYPDRTSPLVLAILRAVIYISILALFYISARTVCDFLIMEGSEVDVTDQSVEEIVARFANYDSAGFAKAMARKLVMDSSIVGAIDVAHRSSDGRLHLVGWAFDKADIYKPIYIFLIVPGKIVFMSSTGQKRNDVTDFFHLTGEAVYAGFDTVFDRQFDCKYNEQHPFIVAVNQTGQFSLLKTSVVISGC
jgi:hypothetical protein